MKRKIFMSATVLVIIGLVLLLLFFVKGGGEWPYGIYTVLTGSMNPTIKAGGIVVTKKTEAGVLREDDILTYSSLSGNMLVTHRIIEVLHDENDGYSYVTKGDANNASDLTPVPYKLVVGRVIFSVNGLGNALMFIRTPLGIMLVVIATLLLVALSTLYDSLIKREKNKADATRNEVTQ